MTITALYESNLTVTEVFSGLNPSVGSDDQTLKQSGLNQAFTLDAESTVPATKVAAFRQLMTNGSATIDLTALIKNTGGTVDLTGLKVQSIKVRALAANANPVTISEGGSNGYELGGNGWTFALAAGQEMLIFLNDAAPDVGSSAKNIGVSGTGSQGIEVIIVAG